MVTVPYLLMNIYFANTYILTFNKVEMLLKNGWFQVMKIHIRNSERYYSPSWTATPNFPTQGSFLVLLVEVLTHRPHVSFFFSH